MQSRKTAFAPFSRPSNSRKFFSQQRTSKPVFLERLDLSIVRALGEPEEIAEDGEVSRPILGICLVRRAIDVSPLPTHRAEGHMALGH